MVQAESKQLPVAVFSGFLEAGKAMRLDLMRICYQDINQNQALGLKSVFRAKDGWQSIEIDPPLRRQEVVELLESRQLTEHSRESISYSYESTNTHNTSSR